MTGFNFPLALYLLIPHLVKATLLPDSSYNYFSFNHPHCMKGILFFLILFLSIAAWAQPKKIAVIGSSTAYGHFIMNGVALYPRDSAWPYKLKRHFMQAGIIDTLYNLSASGNGPYHGMPSSYTPPPGRSQPYYPFNVTRALQYNPLPSVLIVSYPSNQYDYLSKAEIIFCLKTIKDSANVAGIPCYITTSQPRDNFSPSERVKLKQIRDTIMEVFGPWAIDFFTDLARPDDYKIKTEYALGDGVHLNEAGHEVLYQRVLQRNIFPATVPIAIWDCRAALQNNQVVLLWKATAGSELRSIHIQRSANGTAFETIGSMVFASNGQYRFTDVAPLHGRNFYRIEIIGSNGEQKHSAIIEINYSRTQLWVNDIYPNPVGNSLQLKMVASKKTALYISVLNASGQTIFKEQKTIEGTIHYNYNCSALPAGHYVLQLKTDKEKMVKSFFKQ